MRAGALKPVQAERRTAAQAPARGAPLLTRELPLGAAVLRALCALVWVLWGLRLFTAVPVVPGAAVAGLVFTVGGVALMPLAFVPLGPRAVRALDLTLLLGTLAAFALWTQQAIYASPAYGTDEVAFGQGAAQLLLAGHDPYAANLAWTLGHFQVASTDMTNTLAGTLVTRLSYPALSFLVYVPALAVGLHAQAAPYVDAAFWILALVVLWVTVPPPWRLLVPVIGSLGAYIGQVSGGVIDALFVPFAVVGLWRWDRFGDPDERSFARWIGPVAVGLGCAVEQTLWFLVPFLLVGIAQEARRGGHPWAPRLGRYAGWLAAAFLAPNLPFLVWDPGAWWRGTTLPLTHGLVPLGQGLIAIATYLTSGTGALPAYSIAAGCLMVALLALTAAQYGALKRALPILPALVLLVPTRSLSNYVLFLVPSLLVGGLTVRRLAGPPVAPGPVERRVGLGVAGAALLASVAALGVAITSPPPLRLRVTGEQTTGQLATVDALTLSVRNETAAALRPHFAVGLGPYLSNFWAVQRGPRRLAAHTTGRYALWAPGTDSMPSVGEQLVVYGVTAAPAAISVDRVGTPDPLHLVLAPARVSRVLAPHAHVTLRAVVVDGLGAPVRRSGLVVDLGQVVYAETGVFPGETSINRQSEGQSPVAAVTNRAGVAHFTIRGVQVQPDPVFVQAWLMRPYAHGFSNLVSLRFGGPPAAARQSR